MSTASNTNPSYTALSSTHAALKDVRDHLHNALNAIEAAQSKIADDGTSDDEDKEFCMAIIKDTETYLHTTLNHINGHRGVVLRVLEDVSDS